MDYKVPKVSIPVRVVMTAGGLLDGQAFVADIARDHTGPERLEEMLNEPELFMPLVSKGKVYILNKRHLLYMTTSARSEIDYYKSLTTITRAEEVRLILRSGRAVTGTLLVEMPAGMSRVQDYLNSNRSFLPVLVRGQLALVSCSGIVSLSSVHRKVSRKSSARRRR